MSSGSARNGGKCAGFERNRFGSAYQIRRFRRSAVYVYPALAYPLLKAGPAVLREAFPEKSVQTFASVRFIRGQGHLLKFTAKVTFSGRVSRGRKS